jgi:hypothetical protein
MSRETSGIFSAAGAAADKVKITPRVLIVGQQKEYEENLVKMSADACGNLAMMFVVPDMVTPAFVNPDDVEKSGDLWVLKEGRSIPAGLVNDTVSTDPEQLSTVLGRAITLRDMLELGARIIIYSVNESRPAKGKDGNVDNTNVKALFEKYAKQICWQQISREQYVSFAGGGDRVPAATYYCGFKDCPSSCTVYAQQANAADGPARGWSCYPLIGGEKPAMHSANIAEANLALHHLTEGRVSGLEAVSRHQGDIGELFARSVHNLQSL